MKRSAVLKVALAAGVLAAGMRPARADVSAEALLKVLVRKGVLTQQEADDLRAEAAKESSAAPSNAVPPAVQAAEKRPTTTITGYIQARATATRYAQPSTQFLVRRARLIVRNESAAGRMVLSADAGGNAVGARDAYFDFYATPTVRKVQGLTVRAGQYFKPFGLENERGEAEAEFPERPVGLGALFPGFRDIGFTLSRGLDPHTIADLAIVNGNGSGIAGLPGRDNDNYKDVLGRLRYSIANRADFAVSAYKGRNTIAAAGAVPSFTGDRDRYGLAANLYALAGGYARAEVIASRDVQANLGAGAKYGDADGRMWFGAYFHPVGERDLVGVRYDVYDPDVHNRFRLNGDGEVRTLSLTGVRQIAENMRLTLAFDHPRVTRYDTTSRTAASRYEDTLTFQGQYRF